jgi:hypothetical protein
MILTIHTTRLGVWKILTKVWLEHVKGRDTLQHVGGGWSVISKLILEEQCMKDPSPTVSSYMYDDDISGSLNQERRRP